MVDAAGTSKYTYYAGGVLNTEDGPWSSDTVSGSPEGAGGIGGMLARSDGYSSGSWTSHNYYHADGNGNITYMVNSSQSMVATYQYDPFGNPISSSGTLASANVYRFSSKEIHVKSGMYYYGYRFYDPNLQRWLNRDPIQEKGRLNLYRFVRNSPTRFLDTFGKDIFILPPFPGQFPYPPKPGPGPQEDDPPKPKPVPPPKPNPTPTPNPKPPRRPNPRCEDQEQDCQLLDGSQPDVCIYVCDGPEPWVGHTAKKSPNSVCAPTANSGDVKPGVPGFPDFPTE